MFLAKHTFTIDERLPGLNEYIDAERTSKYLAADMKKSVQETIGWLIKSQVRGLKIKGQVHIHYYWVEPNKRRDPSNIAFAKKFIEDALVDIGIIENDGWKHIAGFSDSFSVDKDNPRVEVTIEEVA